ncbi:MAG: hypothetical protein IKR57_02590 [Bacilli bacterium]|nr:hypothetical protein [Bacilli bacterium]
MNGNVDNKITKLKNIQSKLSSISDTMKNDDKESINEVWKDRNSELFLEELDSVRANIDSLIAKIDETIKELAKTSNDGGVL